MEVGSALLCDYATVREGLLHILGGGITRLNRPSFPAAMGCALAVHVLVHPTEAVGLHQVQIIIQSEDGQKVAEAGISFQLAEAQDLVPGEQIAVPIALPLVGAVMPIAGGYSVEILIDGIHKKSLPFRGVLQANPPPPAPPPG